MEFVVLAGFALLLAGASDLLAVVNERLVKLANGLLTMSRLAVGGSAAVALLSLH